MLEIIISLYVLVVSGYETPKVYSSEKVDERVERIINFLDEYDSELSKEANYFIKYGDMYGVDPYLLVSISGVESTFGKKECNRFNPFGYGVPCYSFNSYEDSIRQVAKQIGESKLQGYVQYRESMEIQDLANIYNGGDREKWARDVNFFLEKLNE